MTLAEKLKTARTRRKMSMSEVADISSACLEHRSRITQGYVSRLESGRETNPSYLKLKTLCTIYKIKPETLFKK
jgi:transcriptional regulator with XRE-family HTH domain